MIDPVNSLISGYSTASQYLKEQEKKKDITKTAAFSKVLKKDNQVNTSPEIEFTDLSKSENLEAWIDQIFQRGEDLKKDPTLNSLGAYKKAVGHLLKYVVSESYDLQRSKGVMNPRTFKQKEFVNIEIINRKLDSLAVSVLTSQKDQLEILKRVDEINGLIVDCIG
ncbi:MAG: YaaR family protein [Spirochaetaceae bacterium]|jgi:uncharacterized protein YaaR (DUF327 family)|nr:YaaR family protein [Spirochaetaceae bacterium]